MLSLIRALKKNESGKVDTNEGETVYTKYILDVSL